MVVYISRVCWEATLLCYTYPGMQEATMVGYTYPGMQGGTLVGIVLPGYAGRYPGGYSTPPYHGGYLHTLGIPPYHHGTAVRLHVTDLLVHGFEETAWAQRRGNPWVRASPLLKLLIL